MLQNIRNNIQGAAAKFIIALIIVPFALFGIDSLFGGSGQVPAAVVNGEKISQGELQQAIGLQKRRLIGMMGDQIDPAMLDDAILRKPALNTLIKQQLLLQAADDVGIEISTAQLHSTIAGMPQFQEDGRFSQARYEQVLRLQGYSSSFFKELLKSDLTIQQLSNAVAGSAFVAGPELSRAIGLLYEARDYHFIKVPQAPYREAIKLSDEEISAYYQEHAKEFLSEAAVRYSYLELAEDDFFEPVSEDQILAEYQRLVEASSAQIEREAAHILIEINDDTSREDALKKLQSIRDAIVAGADFGDQARANSADAGSAAEGGTLGYTSGDSFPAEFEEALAALQVGEFSPVVETEAGLHLIKLLDVRQPEVASLDSARVEITERLRRQEAMPRLIAAVEDLKDLVFNAESLAMPAKEMGLTVKQSEWQKKSDSSGLFAFATVKAAAFNADLRSQGLNSEVFELTPEHFAVLHVEEYKKPETLPLADVRDQIVMTLSQSKAEVAAQAKAEEIRTELLAGKRAETIAKAESLTWNAIAAGKRGDLAVDTAIRKRAFAMPRPGAQPSVSVLNLANGDRVVLQLLGVNYGSQTNLELALATEAEKNAYRNRSSQDFSAYFNGLWKSAKIKIN
ncbi:MAG: SurA N-terminal domain-containing protein [Zhongshania sp.]|uniref:SurA N-terminal domain-containing protein n=1 Tax=Zhongshania sp. TaxID=1971902 RepID=UPI00261AECC0|nr:SurA N-terminal domain-containing protein [Zhongshania sp.]MDF1691664.1 SurA N-terminal domain-containing protein [Zhongshania sp.]